MQITAGDRTEDGGSSDVTEKSETSTGIKRRKLQPITPRNRDVSCAVFVKYLGNITTGVNRLERPLS